jgi:hypothetical protein
VRQPSASRLGRYVRYVEIEPHQADIYRLWADALDKRDLTAAQREEYGPMIRGFRAIAEDPSAYEFYEFHALVTQFERARARFASASHPDPPGPTASAPEP